MLGWLRSRLTYSNVLVTLCFFLLLGGGAYAVTGFPEWMATGLQVVAAATTLVMVFVIQHHQRQVLPGHCGVHVVHRHAHEVSDVLTSAPGIPFFFKPVLVVDLARRSLELLDGHSRLYGRDDRLAGVKHAAVHLFLLRSELA